MSDGLKKRSFRGELTPNPRLVVELRIVFADGVEEVDPIDFPESVLELIQDHWEVEAAVVSREYYRKTRTV